MILISANQFFHISLLVISDRGRRLKVRRAFDDEPSAESGGISDRGFVLGYNLMNRFVRNKSEIEVLDVIQQIPFELDWQLLRDALFNLFGPYANYLREAFRASRTAVLIRGQRHRGRQICNVQARRMP